MYIGCLQVLCAREGRRREVNILQRILIAALAFVVGIALMPLTPFLMAWLFWCESDKVEDGQ